MNGTLGRQLVRDPLLVDDVQEHQRLVNKRIRTVLSAPSSFFCFRQMRRARNRQQKANETRNHRVLEDVCCAAVGVVVAAARQTRRASRQGSAVSMLLERRQALLLQDVQNSFGASGRLHFQGERRLASFHSLGHWRALSLSPFLSFSALCLSVCRGRARVRARLNAGFSERERRRLSVCSRCQRFRWREATRGDVHDRQTRRLGHILYNL